MLDTSDAIFGQRLRLERERRRITLASIAANTKISLHLLEGLERGQLSRWPSGIFRRSFIRAYAEAIGLDPDDLTREFLERFPDPPDLPFQSPASDARRIPSNEPVLRLNLADLDVTSTRGRLSAQHAAALGGCRLGRLRSAGGRPHAVCRLQSVLDAFRHRDARLLRRQHPRPRKYARRLPLRSRDDGHPGEPVPSRPQTPSSLFKALGAAFRNATASKRRGVKTGKSYTVVARSFTYLIHFRSFVLIT